MNSETNFELLEVMKVACRKVYNRIVSGVKHFAIPRYGKVHIN